MTIFPSKAFSCAADIDLRAAAEAALGAEEALESAYTGAEIIKEHNNKLLINLTIFTTFNKKFKQLNTLNYTKTSYK